MLLSSPGTSIANVGLPTLAQASTAFFQEVQWVVITGASVMGAVFARASATIDITTARPEAVATGSHLGATDGRRIGAVHAG